MQPIWGKSDTVPLYVGDNGSRLSVLSRCLRRDEFTKTKFGKNICPLLTFRGRLAVTSRMLSIYTNYGVKIQKIAPGEKRVRTIRMFLIYFLIRMLIFLTCVFPSFLV